MEDQQEEELTMPQLVRSLRNMADSLENSRGGQLSARSKSRDNEFS